MLNENGTPHLTNNEGGFQVDTSSDGKLLFSCDFAVSERAQVFIKKSLCVFSRSVKDRLQAKVTT